MRHSLRWQVSYVGRLLNAMQPTWNSPRNTCAEWRSPLVRGWIKLADFEQQKQAALRPALNPVVTHHSALRALTVPKLLSIRVDRIQDG